MNRITVDFNETCGKVKPMHCVNNGPVHKFSSENRISNAPAFREAGFPYARTHDSSYYTDYGGSHIIDINMIFTDFDKDPYDPDSYDFVLTDEYLDMMEAGGVKPFYRLGSKIEHWVKKYNTLPPKDFKKWAVICEHIIRHCNEGWANGHHRNIEYWEIWNEPDLGGEDGKNSPCWGGTPEQFYDLFNITLCHLKECFPDLKIGGPSMCSLKGTWLDGFFKSLKAKPDFFSWHTYSPDVAPIIELVHLAQDWLKKYGLEDVESILDEWNYVDGWWLDDWITSLKTEKSLKGSSFNTAVMTSCQYEPVDMLMYYDARPCEMNGLFATDYVWERLKGYFSLYMFNKLYMQNTAVKVNIEGGDIYAAAAKGDEKLLMFTYYINNFSESSKKTELVFKNVCPEKRVTLEYYCLDEDHDAELIKTESFSSSDFSVVIDLPVYATYLLRIIEEE